MAFVFICLHQLVEVPQGNLEKCCVSCSVGMIGKMTVSLTRKTHVNVRKNNKFPNTARIQNNLICDVPSMGRHQNYRANKIDKKDYQYDIFQSGGSG